MSREVKGKSDKEQAIELTKFILMTKSKEQKLKDALAPVVKKFGYKNHRVPYIYVMQNIDKDPEFKKWWGENKQRK
ncbi:hypothetical protein PG299_02685 [Riemerella anatipestifer]|nr:hypothetical protein [Riemerella anatipestifer]